jgi:hypothetical protein
MSRRLSGRLRPLLTALPILILLAIPPLTASRPATKDYEAMADRAVHTYEAAGFLIPNLRLRIEVYDYMVFLHTHGHIDGDDYVIVLDRSILDPLLAREAIVWHEVFHYIQAAYIDRDPALDVWLTEPTANAMAGVYSGVCLPVPRVPFSKGVFKSELIASCFWTFLLERDPDVVRCFLETSAGTSPTPDGFRAWITARWNMSFDSILTQFEAWYPSWVELQEEAAVHAVPFSIGQGSPYQSSPIRNGPR